MSSGTLPQVDGLQEILDRCQRLIRVHSVLRGSAEALCVLIVCVLVGCALDYLVGLPGLVRLAGLLATLVLTGAVAWKRLIRPLVRTVPADELGAAVDLRFPQLQEAIATLICVDNPAATAGEAGSLLMRNRLHQHVQAQISSIQPSEVVQSQPTVRRWGLATLSLLTMLIPFLLWPAGSQLLLQRFMLPFANLAAPSNLFFEVPEGNRTVAANTDVQLIAIPHWRTKAAGELPAVVVVQLQTAAGGSEDLPMLYSETESHFSVTLAGVRESVRYRIHGGGATTEWFALTVADPPRILAAMLKETPPAYTGRPIQIFDGVVGDLHVFERSALEITLQFNKPVQSAVMDWKMWTPIPAAESPEGAPEYEPPVSPAVLSPDGMSAQFQFEALGSGQFEFRVEDFLELTNLNETTRRLIVTTDTPPNLTVSGVSDGLELRPTDVLPLNCRVIDDISVGELEVQFRKNADAMRIEPAVGFDRGAMQVAHEFQIDLSTLDVHSGDTVTFKVKAADERPVPGPQVVWQGPWTIRISDAAEAIGQKALRESDQQLVESLRKLEEQLRQDANTGNELGDKLSRQWNEEVQQNVRALSEKEQTQGRELQKLAEQAAAHPLMKKQAEKLAGLAQQVRKDIPKKLDAVAAAERDAARQNIQESVNDLNRVREELHRTTDEIEKAAQLEQELAELNRLALEAQQLASDSQKLTEQRQDPQPEEGQSQDDLQKQLDKQQQLQQEQQQLSEDLGSLLQRKQELLQAAREAQLDRAAEIAEQVQRLAQQQQQLAEAVRDEALDAARDAQQLADELQEARNKADRLGDQIQQQTQDVPRPEVQPLDDAIRDLRQGNLAAPHAGIEKAQAQLAQAAESLQNPVAAPAADPDTPALDENTQREEDRRRTEQNEQRQALGEKAAEIHEQLEQIENKIAQMADDFGAKPKKSTDDPSAAENTAARESAAERQPAGKNDAAGEQAAQKSEAVPDGGQPESAVGKKLLKELGQMVEAAHETAESLQADRKAASGAKQQSQQAAELADQAMRHAQAGQFSRAAERMRNSANESGQAAEQLRDNAQQDRQAQLQQQRDGFNRMADMLQQLQNSNKAQVAAQQETQRSVADAADRLPAPLEELAERLNIPELGLQNQARPAQEAAQAAREGAQAGDQASGQLNETQLQQASQKAQEAAGHLSRAAQLAQQSAQGHREPNAMIPTEVGESVNDALQSLKKASEAIDQEAAQRAAAEQQSEPGEGQPGEGQPGEGQPGEGQPGEGQPGEGQPGEGQPGEGQPGEGQQPGKGKGSQGKSGSGQQNSSAQQLANAAKALQSAARKALPNQFSPGQLNSDPGSPAGEPKGEGNTAEFDGQDPGATRRKSNRRQWGQLQDGLDADVRDGGKEVLDSEYSELIRRYRRDLARQGQQSEK